MTPKWCTAPNGRLRPPSTLLWWIAIIVVLILTVLIAVMGLR